MLRRPPARGIDEDVLKERAGAQARLMVIRRRTADARRMLAELQVRWPGDPDVDDLRRRLAAESQHEKEVAAEQRGLRRMLRLDTTWRRWCSAALAVWFLAFGAWNIVNSVSLGVDRGFTTEITTELMSTRRRYRSAWTRPIYTDTIYGVGLIVVSVAWLLTIRALSRTASDWEELDVEDREPRMRGWPWW